MHRMKYYEKGSWDNVKHGMIVQFVVEIELFAKQTEPDHPKQIGVG